jgi:hypothetical protein
MARSRHGVCLLALALLHGCGGASLTSNPGTPPPHGGRLIKLPGGQGYLEVVTDNPGALNSKAADKIAFYFLKDMTTPFSPSPTAGTLVIGKKKTALNSEGDALTLPNSSSVLGKRDIDGVLSVELDGKSINIPLGVR